MTNRSRIYKSKLSVKNDFLEGDAGDDTYVFNSGDGSDTITDSAGIDTIVFGAGITASTVQITTDVNQNVIIKYGASDQLLIQNFFTGQPIESIKFASGGPLDYSQIVAAINVSNAKNNILVGDANGNTLSGLSGDDTLFGGSYNDTLIAGAGDDIAAGGAGADVMSGGDQSDYLFGDSYTGYGYDAGGNPELSFDYVNAASWRLKDSFTTPAHNYKESTLRFDDVIDGGADNDFIFGEIGDDFIAGGEGNDILGGDRVNSIHFVTGGEQYYQPLEKSLQGDDTIYGGSGDYDDLLLAA